MNPQVIPPAKPIAIKERFSMLAVEKGQLDVVDGALVVIDKTGIRTHIPVGGIACLMLEPGTRVSHAAVVLAARVGCLLIWVGEAGVRMYASGQPGGARSDRLLYQAQLALMPELRLKVVRAMYGYRFQEKAPLNRSVEQLRAMEAARVKKLYQILAQQYGVKWSGRRYDPQDWDTGDRINRCISAANSCLYGIAEAAILAAGYAPAIGFLHTGKPQSFVYDIADLIKFETVTPVAFKVASKSESDKREIEGIVRRECRDAFRVNKVLPRLIPLIEDILAAGEIKPPPPHEEAQPIAIPNETGIGDVGHRN